MQSRVFWLLSSFVGAFILAVCATKADDFSETSTNSWPCYSLTAEKIWQLNSPHHERFDASGLVLQKNEQLLTVNDRGAEIYKIEFSTNADSANLVLVTNCFTDAQLAPFAKEKIGRYDCEGVAQDKQGRIYLCEEANRWILRFDPKTKKVDRLPIDWSPVKKYFLPGDLNASFEGIAIGDGKLFVANERQRGRIIVLDLKTLKILDDFAVRPTGTRMLDIHYSDLSWHDGALFAILRENHVVVKIDPKRHCILAEYDFHDMEQAPELAYKVTYPTSTMEGLAVDKNYFWLATDNNGWGRKKFPQDTRPTLFKCRRPD